VNNAHKYDPYDFCYDFGFDGTDTTVSLKLLSLRSHRYIEMVEADTKRDVEIHDSAEQSRVFLSFQEHHRKVIWTSTEEEQMRKL
jgi:hypothetical protein